MAGDAHPIPLRAGDALVITDVQLDFLPGGSLAVQHGDEVVAVLNGYVAKFQQFGTARGRHARLASTRPLLVRAARGTVAAALHRGQPRCRLRAHAATAC